jgi:hypothetical protein
MLGIEWLGPESLAFGYGDRVASFQGWRWVLARVPRALPRLPWTILFRPVEPFVDRDLCVLCVPCGGILIGGQGVSLV